MAKKVQLMTNAKQWQVVDGVEVLVDVPQEDIDPIIDSSCVEIEGYRTLEETINQENMFTPQITETKVRSKVGGVYHDSVVDGAYEEAILYGNTQVNLVTSPTREGKYIPQTFTSFQGDEGVVGVYVADRTNQVAPLVKGVTMVNLVSEGKHSYSIASGNATRVDNIKGDTLYTLSFTFTTKNTNAGITIQSFNNGIYLEDTKSQTNLGDKVVMTFTTHAEANQINICNNKAYGGETIQLDNIMVIEGDVTDLDLPFFKGMRSVELSRPLTNLFTDDLRTESLLGGTATNSGGTVVATAESIGAWKGMAYFLDNKLKPNTKYLVMWDSLVATQTSTTNTDVIIGVYHHDGNTVTTRLGTINASPLCPITRSIVFDTGNYDVTQISIRVHATLSNSETGITTVTGLRVFEWDDSLRTLDLQTIGYFSGTKYVSVRALETEGKNLYPYGDINFTNDYVGWCDAKGKTSMYSDIAQKSSTRFLLKKGTYTFSFGETTNTTYFALVDDKEQGYGSSASGERTFTLSQDTYLTLRLKTTEANVATTVTNIQIERGETATVYEAYQGRYYKPRETEEIILRSLPNGVCDTFNLQTGELVQNIGEVVLDGVTGVQDWQLDGTNETIGISGFYLGNSVATYNFSIQINEQYVISDKFKTISSEEWKNRDTEACIDNTGNIAFLISNSKLSEISGDGFKQYLQQNPITVQYKLKEPIITKLQTYNRIYSGQTNALASMGNNLSALTYYSANTKIKLNNLSPVPAIVEPITILPFDVRLKPNTTYTVKYLSDHSTDAKINLGGTEVVLNPIASIYTDEIETLVKTPTILKHKQVLMGGNGRAYQVIIVEGDITGTELPYFEGMKNVKMPIVKNVGRNLLNESSMRVFYESDIIIRTYDVFPCKPNTRYCFISVGGEPCCNWHVCKKDAHYERPEYESVGITQYLGYTKEIVTPQDCYYMCIHTGSNPTTNREVYDIKTAIYEGSFAECVNYGYEDYKENSVYAVQGEYPITSEMFEQGGFTGASSSSGKTYEQTKYDNITRLRSKDLIPVKPNTTYAFAHSFSKFAYNIYQWNGNKEFIDGVSRYFASGQIETITTTTDTQYIHFLMSKHDASQNITVSEYDWSQFHMYELDSTINLRSLPNGVKDELNLLTGEYIQRVGEIVLDNTETWNMDTTENAIQPNTNIFYTGVHSDFKPLGTVDRAGSLVCDKVNVVPDLYFVDKVGIMSNIDPRVYVRVLKADAPNVATFTTYIQNNPLTLQYELAEPIISHVRLVSNNQEREVGVKLPNGVCNTYNPSTGITTVRVGKVVLDGSENWKEDTAATKPTDLIRFAVKISDMRKGRPYNTGDFVYESNINYNIVNNDIITPRKLPNIWNYYGNNIYMDFSPTAIGMTTSDTTETKISKLKTHLASNPITVWYELNYPQIQPNIVLPNGVHDEYNPETGVYTKRIGFVELDGSTDERLDSTIGTYNKENTIVFFATKHTPLAKKYGDKGKGYPIHTNQFEYSDIDLGQSIGGGFSMDIEGAYMAFDGNPCFAISKEKLEPFGFTNDMNSVDMKEQVLPIASKYLSQNPLKVWYELETPITYQLTPYFALPQPYAYEDGYLIHESAYPETTLPPEFSYKLVANRTGQVMQNSRKLQEHTTRLSNLEALIIEATIESLFNRELQTFELELMDIQLIEL